MGYCGTVNDEFWLLKNNDQKANVINHIQQLDLQKVKAVKVVDWDEPRTKRQNAYLWGWVYANIVQKLNDSGQGIPLETGEKMDWTDKILHEALAGTYLVMPPIKTKRSEINLRKSTAGLNKKEFNEYLENIDKACYNWWGISVPAPTRGVWHEYYKSLGFGHV